MLNPHLDRIIRTSSTPVIQHRKFHGRYTGLQQVAAVFSAEKPVRIISTGMPPSSKSLSTCTRIPDAKIRQLIGGE
jgi:hypothetical protein